MLYSYMCVSLPSVVTVEFDPMSYTVFESDGFVNITVVKREQTTQTVSVDFSTADGSATGKKQLWIVHKQQASCLTSYHIPFPCLLSLLCFSLLKA